MDRFSAEGKFSFQGQTQGKIGARSAESFGESFGTTLSKHHFQAISGGQRNEVNMRRQVFGLSSVTRFVTSLGEGQ